MTNKDELKAAVDRTRDYFLDEDGGSAEVVDTVAIYEAAKAHLELLELGVGNPYSLVDYLASQGHLQPKQGDYTISDDTITIQEAGTYWFGNGKIERLEAGQEITLPPEDLKSQLATARADVMKLRGALEKIAGQDYRGNRPLGATIAYKALQDTAHYEEE